MKSIPLVLLLCATSALAAKHNYRQGKVIETHTEYVSGNACSWKSQCPKTEVVIESNGKSFHLIGAWGNGYYPDLLHVGDTVTFDFVKTPDVFVMEGDKPRKFNIQSIQ